MPFKEITQDQFDGGINAVSNPFKLNKNQILRGRNLLLDEHASLVTRPGSAIRPVPGPATGPYVYLGTLKTLAGAVIPFAMRFATGGNVLARIDTNPWTTIGTISGSPRTPHSTTVLGQEVFAVDYEVPWIWDGVSFTRMTAAAGQTVPPGARHLALHRERLWVWNTSATTTTLDGDSSLRQSDPNNPNSWPNANQTFISRGDGTQGMGLATFTIAETGISPTASLIAFKDRSAYQVTGTLDSTFAVQKLKSDMGCVAPRTIQFVAGYGIIRLTHKGFALFNGVDDRLISEEVRPYIFGHDEVSPIDFAHVDQSWATQSFNPPLYICGCPVTSGASALDRYFVYDLIRRAWAICDFPTTYSTLATLTLANQQPEVWAGASTATTLWRLFNAQDYQDNGSEVAWSLTSRRFGSATKPSFWRRLVVGMTYQATQTILAQVITGSGRVKAAVLKYQRGVPSTQTATFTYGGSTYGTALYGPSPLGFYTYGSAAAQYGVATYGFAGSQAGAESLDILETAPWVDVKLSGSGAVRIREISLQALPKPVTKLATVPV